MILLLFSTIALCLTVACQAEDSRPHRGLSGDGTEESTLGSASGSPEGSDTVTSSDNGCNEVDLLFVIDNSASMESVKSNLMDNFPRFVGVLEDYNTAQGGQLRFRLGVTTSSATRDFFTTLPNSDFEQPFSTTGDDGKLLGQAECELNAPWTEGPSSTFRDEFACLAELPANDSAVVEMPLLATQLALGPQSAPGGPNAGFFTPQSDALLVMVIITNEEDCSIQDGGRLMFDGAGMCDDKGSEGLLAPESMKAFLDELTGGEGRYFMLAIAGPGPGKCESIFGQAWEAVRLKKMVKELGDYGMFGSLCEDDLWLSLEKALGSITATCDALPPIV